MSQLSHFDEAGTASMVDVGAKADSRRTARARAVVRMRPEVVAALPGNPKGNPLEVARIAGIQAAKKTSDLIPLCHPLALTHVDVAIEVQSDAVVITSTASLVGPTGVEMEAMVAASVAALTVYDMCKALDKGIEIHEIVLLGKTGGKSGKYVRA